MVTAAPRPTGTGQWVRFTRLCRLITTHRQLPDATTFFESTFWDDSDPVSGLGGWGDAKKDYEVQDGGFSTFTLSYPSPHILRRNFTERPYEGLDDSSGLFPIPDLEANSTFTVDAIASGINGYAGDFPHFQQWMESGEGPHGSVHLIMGG